jgi:CPA2 family monovalent cation:H+ antiporter-2
LEESIEGHVAIVGYGRVGRHIVNLLGELDIPYLVIESDTERIETLALRGVPTLYGDASNSEVLTHAGLERARALVVAAADESATELIVGAARDIAPNLPINARATTEEGLTHLEQLGEQDVIHPDLEGGLEIVRHTLLALDFPVHEIMRYMDAVRHDHYDLQINTEEEHRILHDLLNASGNIEVTWIRIEKENSIIGQTLAEANLRARTGASVVAIMRNKEIMANPKSMTVFEAGDRIGIIGEKDQVDQAEKMLLETKDNDTDIEKGLEWET